MSNIAYIHRLYKKNLKQIQLIFQVKNIIPNQQKIQCYHHENKTEMSHKSHKAMHSRLNTVHILTFIVPIVTPESRCKIFITFRACVHSVEHTRHFVAPCVKHHDTHALPCDKSFLIIGFSYFSVPGRESVCGV